MEKRVQRRIYWKARVSDADTENNIDMDSVKDNLNGIREFAQRHEDVNTVMTLVPNAAYILKQLTPANAPVRDQSRILLLQRILWETC